MRESSAVADGGGRRDWSAGAASRASGEASEVEGSRDAPLADGIGGAVADGHERRGGDSGRPPGAGWSPSERVDREREEWARFLLCEGFVPKSHITLTFDRKKQAVQRAGAVKLWRALVRVLNSRLGGVEYRRRWGHSYFSYVLGVEFHKSGAVHMHAAVDRYVDYVLLRAWWEAHCGYVWIRQCERGDGTHNGYATLAYVLKYVTKDDSAPSVWLNPQSWDVVVESGRVVGCARIPATRRSSAPVKGESGVLSRPGVPPPGPLTGGGAG